MKSIETKIEDLARDIGKYESPLAIIGVGMQGSGKTTVLRPLAERLDATYLSADMIRKELTGNEDDQSVNKEAWEIVHERAGAALASDRSVIIDGIHIERRPEAAQLYRRLGARGVIAVFVDVPLKLAMARNRARERVIRNEVIRHASKRLQESPVTLGEGFDTILRVDNSV